MTDRRPALDALTSLRFLAALSVVIAHYWRPGGGGDATPLIVETGHFGVTFFFVLSGFILSYTYDTGGRFPASSLRSFYLARLARVYPLYLATFVIVLPMLVPLLARPNSELPGLQTWAIASPLLLQSWFPGSACFLNCPNWSISTEAFFYLVFPFALPVILARPKRAGAIIIVAMAAIGVAETAYWLATIGPTNAMKAAMLDRASAGYRLMELYLYFPPLRLPEFLLGIALYGLWAQGMIRWSTRSLSLAALLGAVIVVATVRWIPENMLRAGWGAIAIAPLILAAASTKRGPLVSAGFVWLGRISFALYLIHVPVASWLATIDRRLLGAVLSAYPSGFAMLAMAMSLAAAALLFHFIEEPARRAIRRPAGDR